MKMNRQRLLTTAFAVMIFAVNAAAQTGTTGQLKGGPSTNTCSASDKLEVTAFSINPSQPANGQAATVKLTIKNKCASGTAPITFNWDIAKNDQVLAEGNKQLAAGASTEFTATWTAAAGSHHFYGGISTNHTTLGETQASAGNNTRDLNLTVTPPPLITQYLDRKKAKEAGANFSVSPGAPLHCNMHMVGGNDAYPYPGPDIVYFGAGCSYQGGAKADYEAFSNFTLKNGWKVKSYEILNPITKKGDWKWVVTPSSGSTNPYSRLHLWVDSNGAVNVRLRITIEGPEGTNPYQ